MNYFDSNLIIYAKLDETELGDWARDILESVQNEEMPAFSERCHTCSHSFYCRCSNYILTGYGF